jgi:predicted phosphodiesterase
MAKLALISDVHANLPALNAVLNKLDAHSPDAFLCLGDLVGYGPHPEACLKIIRERQIPCVLGNHDAGVTGVLPPSHFRNPNRSLIEKTSELLSENDISWLKSLPYTLKDELNGLPWIAAHASPKDPEKWEYVESAMYVRNLLSENDYQFIFIGHTHKPALVADQLGVKSFKKGHKYLINPGSVGQSRDGDRRASCALIDTIKMEYHNFRVDYDIQSVVTDLQQMGFSREAADHLMRLNRD